MEALPGESVALLVTSPPYPMIEMWDPAFSRQAPHIASALKAGQAQEAFERMHRILDAVWEEAFRVLKRGGIACINVGDATRTVDSRFSLFPNHARVLAFLQKLGFTPLPCILWRKQTNAPNKFMGSGMLPPTAYVTLEHEYILIVRKGSHRAFKTDEEKRLRRESAFFWEERNTWFSDVWTDLKGTAQDLPDEKTRKRSGAFPFELAYRLISMFSIKGDTVLDPFAGMGTTLSAAMACGRHSIGYEIDGTLRPALVKRIEGIQDSANARILKRLEDHVQFIGKHLDRGKTLKHFNGPYQFPVVTRQETELFFNELLSVEKKTENRFEVRYLEKPSANAMRVTTGHAFDGRDKVSPAASAGRNSRKHPTQRSLFP